MIVSTEVRKEMKRLQLLRLKAKADKNVNYGKWFAAQPLQVAKARMMDEIHQVQAAQRQSVEDLEMAKVTGINIEIAETAVREASMTILKLEMKMKQRFQPGIFSAALGDGK